MELSKSVVKHIREESSPGSKELVLAGQWICSLAPGTFDDDTDLESVDLSSNQIKQIDKDVFKSLVVLKTLSLNINPIKKLSLADFPTSLVHLHLQNCELKTSDFKFSSLPNLETLDLRHGKVTKLMPDIFAGLTKLKVLNLAHCGLYM